MAARADPGGRGLGEDAANLIRRGLEEEGFASTWPATATRRCGSRREHPYDAIVLDVALGGPDSIDGYEVCRQAAGRGAGLPILMLTARDAVEDRVHGLDVGADDYLTKPFAFDELLAQDPRADPPRPGGATG